MTVASGEEIGMTFCSEDWLELKLHFVQLVKWTASMSGIQHRLSPALSLIVQHQDSPTSQDLQRIIMKWS